MARLQRPRSVSPSSRPLSDSRASHGDGSATCSSSASSVSEAQLEQGLAQQRETGGKIGEILVAMGMLDDRDLVDTLSEFLGVPVSNLRRENVEPDALALIPEEVAREQHAVPIRVVDAGLDVAAAEPSEELRDLLAKTAGRPVRMMIAPMSDIQWAIDSNYRAIGGVDNLIAAFVSVEGSRKRTSGDAAGRRPHVRRRARRPGRRPDPHPGDPRPRIGRPHRARRRRRADSLPRRRRAEGGAHAARRHGAGAREPDQDHGGHEHRRASSPAGRSAPDDDRRRRRRRPRRDRRHHRRRELRPASARQVEVTLPPRRPRHAPRHPRDVLEDRPCPVRHDALRRPDGQREDDDALRDAERGQQPDPQRHDDRGPRRVRLPVASTRSRPTSRPASPSRPD